MPDLQPVIRPEADWPVCRLGDLVTTLRRGTAPVYVDDSGVMAIGQRCITNTDFDPSWARHHSPRAMAGTLRPEVGDVLINSTGTGTIGRSVLLKESGSGYIVDGHVTVARTRNNLLLGRWLNDIVRSPEGQRYLEAWCYAGSTNQVELSVTALAAMPIAVPPIDEQCRIAGLLDAVDERIRLAESILFKLRTTRSGLADHLLTAGIDDSGRVRDRLVQADEFRYTALGPRPAAWHVEPLGEFLDRSEYGISSSLSETGRVPVLRMNNFADGEAKLDELKYSSRVEAERLTLQPGDVLFNRTNSIEHVGRTGIWRGQLATASFASYLVRLVPNDLLQNEYLNHLLNLRQTQVDLRQWATTGVHQVNVNPTNLRRVIVAVPDSLAEQDRICDALASYDKRIREEYLVLSKLRQEKSGLLADLLRGRVRMPAEVAS